MHRAQAFRFKARVFQGHEQTAQPFRAKDHAKPTAPAGGPTGGGAEILQSTGAVAPGILKAEGGVVAGAGFKIRGIGHGQVKCPGGDQIPILPEIPGNEPGPVRKAVALKIRLGQIAGLGAELYGGCGGSRGYAQQQHRQNSGAGAKIQNPIPLSGPGKVRQQNGIGAHGEHPGGLMEDGTAVPKGLGHKKLPSRGKVNGHRQVQRRPFVVTYIKPERLLLQDSCRRRCRSRCRHRR